MPSLLAMVGLVKRLVLMRWVSKPFSTRNTKGSDRQSNRLNLVAIC
jgi:hypothetical protein